jgi:hypothetical protein
MLRYKENNLVLSESLDISPYSAIFASANPRAATFVLAVQARGSRSLPLSLSQSISVANVVGFPVSFSPLTQPHVQTNARGLRVLTCKLVYELNSNSDSLLATELCYRPDQVMVGQRANIMVSFGVEDTTLQLPDKTANQFSQQHWRRKNDNTRAYIKAVGLA